MRVKTIHTMCFALLFFLIDSVAYAGNDGTYFSKQNKRAWETVRRGDSEMMRSRDGYIFLDCSFDDQCAICTNSDIAGQMENETQRAYMTSPSFTGGCIEERSAFEIVIQLPGAHHQSNEGKGACYVISEDQGRSFFRQWQETGNRNQRQKLLSMNWSKSYFLQNGGFDDDSRGLVCMNGRAKILHFFDKHGLSGVLPRFFRNL
ncbi:MAG: hypothetical protein ACPG5T_10850 [Endozoicomonas sp.]